MSTKRLMDNLDGLATPYKALVRACPLRFFLQNEVAAQTITLAITREDQIRLAAPHLSFPSERCWFEWRDRERCKVIDDLGYGMPLGPFNQRPIQVGIYVETDNKGRKGFFDVIWKHEQRAPCEVSTFRCVFDFDEPVDHKSVLVDVTALRRGVTPNAPPVPLEENAGAVANPFMQPWYKQMTQLSIEEFMLSDSRLAVNMLSDIMPEFGHILAVLFVLSAKRATLQLDHTAMDLVKLNKKRRKDGKPSLLPYREVTMNLSPVQARRGGVNPRDIEGQGSRRKAAVAHWVSAHYKVRKTGIYLWSSHVRHKQGGEPIPKNITVRGD